MMGQPADPRPYLEREVAARARHDSDEHVRTTCSFARAERLLGREYHGRFLIELLQNAADAWANDSRSESARSRVAVLVTEGPALVVANQGAPMTAQVVIESLGHIGASTKAEGEAIGHKGIGFKAVLEMTLGPEIYSGGEGGQPSLAVRFDPVDALAAIRGESPDWDDTVLRVGGLDHDDELAAVPVLRFPQWVTDLPPDVEVLLADGYDTVVRLPFDGRYSDRLGLTEDEWLAGVRDAIGGVSDQILLLLGSFAELSVEDRLGGRTDIIRPIWEQPPSGVDAGATAEVIRIERNGELSSRWRVLRRTLPDHADLAGEIAVGLRISGDAEVVTVHAAIEDEPSAPFHLFFPTRIASGLPFLLHGYFEVDAARTGFYQGSANRNRAILDALADLVAQAVAGVSDDGSVDLAGLANLLGAAPEPEDSLARIFRARVFDLLDHVRWVPAAPDGSAVAGRRPAEVLVAKPELTRLIATALPAPYVQARIGLGVPVDELSDEALELVATRSAAQRAGLWETLAELLRPGDLPVWGQGDEDKGFLDLLDLLTALEVEDRSAATELIEGLRGHTDARLLPVVGDEVPRVLLPVPDPSEAVVGRRSQLVMARVRSSGARPLVPPPELEVAFLDDGLLSSEGEIDRAKPLGVRAFTVDNVLDRLNGLGSADVDGERLLRFLWGLLARERVSGFGTRRCAERAGVFEPGHWFWCRPGRAREDETTRLRQQRERYLADVPLPCRDGTWRSGGALAFGADWAAWLADHGSGQSKSPATQARITAYEAMEAIAPGDEAFLAPPEVLVELLGNEPFEQPFTLDEEDDAGEALDAERKDIERHAFLLRLGVWEVPPIEAFESRVPAGREHFPWTGPWAERQQEVIAETGGWLFGLDNWSGGEHRGDNVYLGEDFRFRWPLAEMAARDASALLTGMRLGHRLYADRLDASVFCTKCANAKGSHTAWRHSSSADGYPSWLQLQIREESWLSCTLDGTEMGERVPPRQAWWLANPPSGAGLRQSPWRLLPVCGPPHGVTDDLRDLAGLNTIEDADVATVEELLVRLRQQYERRQLVVDPISSGSAHQAFVSLHRLAYERLATLGGDSPGLAGEVLARTGVLSELGDQLVYRPPGETRHDDGRFATYIRHFLGSIPFAVLSREREVTAKALGIPTLEIRLTRQGHDDGQDVTDEAKGLHGDRIAELLAIVVHHSLGTQTLEVTSTQFEERARRLQSLRIRQMDDLVVDAAVEGSEHSVTIGYGSDRDLFLEQPLSAAPVLFHDLAGHDWADRLRRRIAPHYAALLENAAYNHTFALFLQADSDGAREEFLLELGISNEEVDAIGARIGAVTEEEKERHRRWFTAILRVLGAEGGLGEVDLEPAALCVALIERGLPPVVAQSLVDEGGGELVRSEANEGGPLWLLADHGVDLVALDDALRKAGDAGLSLQVAKRVFSRWAETHRRRLAVVLSPVLGDDAAKAAVRALAPPPELGLALDPQVRDLLGPVVAQLDAVGFTSHAEDLADRPEATLAALGGFPSVAALDDGVLLLYDAEEQKRVLRERAGQWRREIRLIAVLARVGPGDTRASIRSIDEQVVSGLLVNPAVPSDLVEASEELLSDWPGLRDHVVGQLVDAVTSPPPDRDALLLIAADAGVVTSRLAKVDMALGAPRRDQARALLRRSHRLETRGIRPTIPAGLGPIPASPISDRGGKKKVAKVKVEPSHDQRKKELGDEGELWALAAVVNGLCALDQDQLEVAIEQIEALLDRFEGAPVESALAHVTAIRSRELDEEELVDELTGLLHLSLHSDAFGFDLLGWLPPEEGRPAQAMCLEVKSSAAETFNLSRGEWSLARKFHREGDGGAYAVLVVRRAKSGGLPAGMDLLVNPAGLLLNQQLRRRTDGYTVKYAKDRAGEESSG